VYASLDVMVSSSRQEGLPIAVLEGMASGLALVATAVGAVPTVVEDGRTGVLVPAENAELLATGIADLLRDPAKRRRLGDAARRLMEEEYSAARMTEDYLRVYEEAIASSQGGAR
jgi:glycosyltransferase involved in cell wall biosynthesis